MNWKKKDQVSIEQEFGEMVKDVEEVLEEKPELFIEEVSPKRDMTWFLLVGLVIILYSGLEKISGPGSEGKIKSVQLTNQNEIVHRISK